jgi:hypothetical protein
MPASSLHEVFNRHRRTLEAHAPKWGKSPAALFAVLAQADPSDEPVYGHNKKLYTDWLVRQLDHGLEAHNLPNTTHALRLHVSAPTTAPIASMDFSNLYFTYLYTARNNFIEIANAHVGLHEWKNVPGFPGYKTQFPGFVIDTLIKHDPQKGRNVPHMLRWLQVKSAARLLPEDLPKVEDDLRLLIKHRAQISPASKHDLANCETYQDFAGIVARFRPDFSHLPRGEMEDYALDREQAKLLADTPHFRLIHVTTQRGAQLLGKGTRWCTSWGDGDGRRCWFPQYQDNLLYLRVKRTNAIYQLHFGEWMHNDAQDTPIEDLAKFITAIPQLAQALKSFALMGYEDKGCFMPIARLWGNDKTAENIGKVALSILKHALTDPDFARVLVKDLRELIDQPLNASDANCPVVAILATCKKSDILWARVQSDHDLWIEQPLARYAANGNAKICEQILRLVQTDPVCKRRATATLYLASSFLISKYSSAPETREFLEFCRADPHYGAALPSYAMADKVARRHYLYKLNPV